MTSIPQQTLSSMHTVCLLCAYGICYMYCTWVYHLPGNKANTTCWLCCLDHSRTYHYWLLLYLWSMICRCVLSLFFLCIFRNYDTACFLAVLLLVNVVILENFFPKLSSTNNNRVTQLYHISRFSNLDAVFMEICILPCIWFDFNPPVTGTTKSWAGPRNEADTWKYMYEKRPVWLCGLMM